MKRIRVMLVDDHELIRSGISSVIETSGDIVVAKECRDGKEVIEYLEKYSENIDVILMDITMPEMSGIEVTEIISNRFPNVKVLALTMHAEEPYIMKMVKAGARGYILKDSNRNKIVEAIKAVYNEDSYYSNEVSSKLIGMLLQGERRANVKLSRRELQVLKFVVDGGTNREIAKELYISDRTVESHRRNMIKKLNLKNSAELVKYALSNELV